MLRPFTRALFLSMLLMAAPFAAAESSQEVTQRFSFIAGEDNVQPGCTTLSRDANPCHQIATSMNGLDSPKIDVLILVPVSPTAERDMRILRQSTEMWADGINWTAADMGLTWLSEGVEFHIFMEMINTGESEFTTYPIVDPEIVIVASNPVGGIGIGVDPSDFIFGNFFGDEDIAGPCHGVANPFDHAAWEALPGFDSHHGGRSGTYVEDCGGAGGNICFSVNAAIDPVPTMIDFFQLYDLASHETGHCLTLGHVGDGAEGSWSSVPTNDIMAYHSDPPGKSKCVSTLDVEAFAVQMSKYLDTDGDGNVTEADRYYSNDAQGDFDSRPFQIQHPDNHYYASPTRQAIDCPQPDFSPVPLSEVVDFMPEAAPRQELAIHSLVDDEAVAQGPVHVAGRATGAMDGQNVTVSFRPLADFFDDPMGEGKNTAVYANTTIVDGAWSLNIDLSGIADGDLVLVSAEWHDGTLIDSDRVRVLVNATVPVSEAARPPVEIEAVDDAEAPGAPLLALLAMLGAIVVLRRR